MSLLDFSQNRKVEFEFINLDGKTCTYSKTITAEDLDKFKKVQDDNQSKMIKAIKMKNVKMKDIENANLDIDNVLDFFADDSKVRDEFNKIFLGDRVNEFKEDTKGIFDTVAKALNQVLVLNIDELNKTIFDTDTDGDSKKGN